MLFKVPVTNKEIEYFVFQENYLLVQIHLPEPRFENVLWTKNSTGVDVVRTLSLLFDKTVIES